MPSTSPHPSPLPQGEGKSMPSPIARGRKSEVRFVGIGEIADSLIPLGEGKSRDSTFYCHGMCDAGDTLVLLIRKG